MCYVSLEMSPFAEEYSDEWLILWFQEVANGIGRTPSARDLKESGGPTAMTYYRRFGSLGLVARKAGLEPRGRGNLGKVG